ncbi:MAG: hypothetical protein AAB403_17760, partial [Planctomycetota bacterium]
MCLRNMVVMLAIVSAVTGCASTSLPASSPTDGRHTPADPETVPPTRLVTMSLRGVPLTKVVQEFVR